MSDNSAQTETLRNKKYAAQCNKFNMTALNYTEADSPTLNLTINNVHVFVWIVSKGARVCVCVSVFGIRITDHNHDASKNGDHKKESTAAISVDRSENLALARQLKLV